jgi:FAD/FMN-containing dehydrogenase
MIAIAIAGVDEVLARAAVSERGNTLPERLFIRVFLAARPAAARGCWLQSRKAVWPASSFT